MGLFKDSYSANHQLRKIYERLEKLEEKVFKTARKDTTTLRQQLLLLKELGMLERLDDLKLSREKKAKLLSILLNGSFDNIRTHLTEIHKKDSELKTSPNYHFLLKTFEEIGLKEKAKEIDNTLREIINKEEEADRAFHNNK